MNMYTASFFLTDKFIFQLELLAIWILPMNELPLDWVFTAIQIKPEQQSLV